MICISLILSALCVLALANPLADNKPSWRIVGGDDAAPGAYPFIISLRVNNSHICGGSVLGGLWVVTAAHCVNGATISLLTVVVGTNQLDAGGVAYSVKRTIVHEDFNNVTLVNDIALIKLTTPIVENDLIQHIDLDTVDNDVPRPVTLIGWGRTSYAGEIPNDLQYLELQTISIKDCRLVWIVPTVNDNQVCTFTKVGEGACNGDSGGPLVNAAGQLTGLVSRGKPCAEGWPDVFTKVASFVSWINAKIGN